MKNITHSLLIILILLPLGLFPQVPGYQGKKISFHINSFFAPSFVNPNANE